MRFTGASSWTFAEDQIPWRMLLALFIRDSTTLDIPPDPSIPPRLAGSLPERRDVLDADDRVAAGRAWPAWWHAIVETEVQRYDIQTEGGGGRMWHRPDMRQVFRENQELLDRLRRMEPLLQAVIDPPDFHALDDRPALRRAAMATFAEALGLHTELRSRATLFDYRLLQREVRRIARRWGVKRSALRGTAIVLPVEGIWWSLPRPGVVICSAGAARDPMMSRRVLADVFGSTLEHLPAAL